MGLSRQLEEIDRGFAHLKYELSGLKMELKFRRLIARKAGFDPDQPRDAHGMWTDGEGGDAPAHGGGGENQVIATFADIASIPLAAQIEEVLGGENADGGESVLQTISETVIQNEARTGIPTIDEMTEKLTDTLKNVMDTVDFIPEQAPNVYGIAVHAAFATSIKAQNLDGVTVEETFSLDDIPRYGAAGSIRTDVTLRDVAGDVIAIYDLKTGGAVLTTSRADQLRERTGAGDYTPVIELHFQRGSRLKHEQVTQSAPLNPAARAGNDDVRSASHYQADRLHRARLLPRYDAA